MVFFRINITEENKELKHMTKQFSAFFVILYDLWVNLLILEEKLWENERLINFRVMPLLEYAQMLKSIGNIFVEFSKKESDNQTNCDFSRPYSKF